MTDDDHKPGSPPGSDRGVYGISVAAELSGINEQSLRLYERQGLLTPARSKGGTRRYSADDLIASYSASASLSPPGLTLPASRASSSWKTATISSTSATPPWKMTTLRRTPPKPAANQQNDELRP